MSNSFGFGGHNACIWYPAGIAGILLMQLVYLGVPIRSLYDQGILPRDQIRNRLSARCCQPGLQWSYPSRHEGLYTGWTVCSCAVVNLSL